MLVGGVVCEGRGGGHDVAVDVAAPAQGRAASVCDGSDHRLEVLLLDAMKLHKEGRRVRTGIRRSIRTMVKTKVRARIRTRGQASGLW